MCAVSVFDLDELNKRILFLEAELNKPEVYSNIGISTGYNKELTHKKQEVEEFNNLKTELEFVTFALDNTSENDSVAIAEIESTLAQLEKDVNKAKKILV